MLTAEALRHYTGDEGALDLLRSLGYPGAIYERITRHMYLVGIYFCWATVGI